jgi:hypothetical protein
MLSQTRRRSVVIPAVTEPLEAVPEAIGLGHRAILAPGVVSAFSSKALASIVFV